MDISITGLDFKTIGRKIRERRQTLGITQEYIANQLDVNSSHISNIECGRANPSLTALVKIANILSCSVDYFLEEEYTYENAQKEDSSIETQILRKLKNCNAAKKEKILKIIDII